VAEESKKSLTPLQERFVAEYLIDLHAGKAYRRAGYKASNDLIARVEGFRLLTKPNIAAAVAAARAALAADTKVSAERVLQEYAHIAFSDMSNFIKFNADGEAVLDWSSMPPGATKAIAEIVQEEYLDGKGKNARPIKRTRFKLHDKKGALDSLARHLGLFPRDGGVNVEDNRTQTVIIVKRGDSEKAIAARQPFDRALRQAQDGAQDRLNEGLSSFDQAQDR
jgi:phage terminase small subunit